MIRPGGNARDGRKEEDLDTFATLIVGRGKLAQELLEGLDGISRVVPWDDRGSLQGERCIVVHAGSGRELGDVFAFCAGTGATLLDLSTAGSAYPDAASFPIVICPNVNMQMLYFMAMVKHAARYFRGQDIRISESHQASKRTTPGTAVYLADSLGVPESRIRSERDPQIQHEKLGIPSEHLDRHAWHEILIGTPDVDIRLQTRVLGKSAYASGLAGVLGIVAARKLAPGCHDVVDLVAAEAAERIA